MLQALGYTGELNSAQYAGVAPALSALGAATSTPYAGLNSYSNLINALTGKYGTTTSNGTSTQTTNPGLLGGLGQIAQIGSIVTGGGGLGSLFGGGGSAFPGVASNGAITDPYAAFGY
jgi:hypothetical protein